MPRVLIRGFTVCINVFIVITSLSREVYSCEGAIVKLHACFLPRVIIQLYKCNIEDRNIVTAFYRRLGAKWNTCLSVCTLYNSNPVWEVYLLNNFLWIKGPQTMLGLQNSNSSNQNWGFLKTFTFNIVFSVCNVSTYITPVTPVTLAADVKHFSTHNALSHT